MISNLFEILGKLLKQLIFEEIPDNEAPKETLQRKILIARNNISAGKLGSVLFVGLSILMFVIIAIRAFIFSDVEDTSFLILLSVLFLFAAFIINKGAEDTRNRLSDLELAYDIEQFEINKEVSYAEKTLRLHNIQLEKYYSENLNQSRWIFVVGLLCILVGLGIVVATCYYVNTSTSSDTSKIIISILGGLSALLTDFVAALYLKMNSEISSTLRDFHSRLVDTHKILLGNLIAAKIEDRELKHQTLSEIAKEVCGKASVTE